MCPRPARDCRSGPLLPLVALVSGYTSALASTAHVDAAASALLLLAFAALVGLGWGAVRYAVASVRHHRSARSDDRRHAPAGVLMASRVRPFQGPT